MAGVPTMVREQRWRAHDDTKVDAMTHSTADRSRTPGGQPKGGEFATEVKSVETGVDLSQETQNQREMDEIRRYNASGSFFYPRAPKSVAQALDFWESVSIPDSALATFDRCYNERAHDELDEMRNRIHDEEVAPQWNKMVEQMGRKERKELERKMEEVDPETGQTQRGKLSSKAYAMALKRYKHPASILNPDVQTALRSYGIARYASTYPQDSEESKALWNHKMYLHTVGREATVAETVELFRMREFHDDITLDRSAENREQEREEQERQHREVIETQQAVTAEQNRIIAELVATLRGEM